ncbi:MAG: sugar nucleotide-binding protein [Planctomycetia bacterium]|nr:sugar nucleotide-binding protein [Planctomycetia bacterium]
MKIALIGCKGTLGSVILKNWNKKIENSTMTGHFNQQPPDEIIPFDLPEFDVSSRRFVLDALTSLKPDVIINASGIHLIDWLEMHPNTARTINIYGAANLREAAKRINALLVQISCGEVFYSDKIKPNELLTPKKETDNAQPESVFAKSKLDSERAASEWERHLIVRTSSLFGPSGNLSGGNLVDTLLRAFLRTQQIQVINDHYCSPTYSVDLVRGLRSLVLNQKTGRFHLCNQGMATPFEIAQVLVDLCGLKRHNIVPISMKDYGYSAAHSCLTALDCSKYHQLENVYQMPDWKFSLRQYIESRNSFSSTGQ